MESGFLKLFQILSSGVLGSIPLLFSLVVTFLQIGMIFIDTIINKDISIMIEGLARIIAAADYNIYYHVQIALNSPESFGIFNIMAILSSVFLLRFFITQLNNNVIAVILSNSSLSGGLGTTLISMIILGLIELFAVKLAFGEFVFPFIGLFTLLFNLPEFLGLTKSYFSDLWMTFKSI